MRQGAITRRLGWFWQGRAARVDPLRHDGDAAELLAVDRAIAELAAVARKTRRNASAGDGPFRVGGARFAGWALLLVLLTASATRADDAPALSIVTGKGLTKAGVTFVVAGEEPVLAKVKALKALYAEYAAAAGKQNAAEQLTTQLAQLDTRYNELKRNVDDLNQRINEQGFLRANSAQRPGLNPVNNAMGALPQLIAQRDLFKNALDEVSQQQAALKAQSMPVKDRSASDDDLKAKAEACKTAIAELRPLIAEVTRQYAKLGTDTSLKDAIGTLAKDARANLKLGPSRAFRSAVKAVDEAERRLLRKPSPSRPSSRSSKKKSKAARSSLQGKREQEPLHSSPPSFFSH